jgi:hypothetical protein
VAAQPGHEQGWMWRLSIARGIGCWNGGRSSLQCIVDETLRSFLSRSGDSVLALWEMGWLMLFDLVQKWT